MHSLIRFRLACVVLWMACAAVTAIVLGNLNLVTYYRLARNGVQTTARVIGKDRNNHLSVHYRYPAGPVEYDEVESAGSQAVFDSTAIGSSITVTYLPESPGISCWGDPKKQLRN